MVLASFCEHVITGWVYGRYSIYPWVGTCGPAPQTLTPVETKIVGFLIPCLRHLAPNYTLFKKFAKKRYTVPPPPGVSIDKSYPCEQRAQKIPLLKIEHAATTCKNIQARANEHPLKCCENDGVLVGNFRKHPLQVPEFICRRGS